MAHNLWSRKAEEDVVNQHLLTLLSCLFRNDIVMLLHRCLALLHRHRQVAITLTMYAAAAFVIPTLAPVPLTDDWIYAQSVQVLLKEHSLHVLDVSVATVVFQVVWGAVFAAIFGMSFGILRVSTIVLVAISSLALYHLCLDLGIDRERSALGAAVYLFNPLSFAISYSFMTDPHFMGLLVIATYFYMRSIQHHDDSARMMLVGSIAASMAFLVRQQGALIPISVAVYLLISGRIPLRVRSIPCLLRVGGIPAATLIGYYAWLQFVNGVPHWQQGYLNIALGAGGRAILVLVLMLVLIGVMYLGFFILPMSLAVVPSLRRIAQPTSRVGMVVFTCWMLIVVAALGLGIPLGFTMPYVPHFLSIRGLGPSDLIVNPTRLLSHQFLVVATLACGVSAIVFIIALCSQIKPATTSRISGAGLLVSIGIWQGIGIIPASIPFRGELVDGQIAPSLDRYFLPLLPLGICLLLWATRETKMLTAVSWAGVAVFAVFSVMGTRDALVLQNATWHLDELANRTGIQNVQLDGGAAWDGYQLYGFSQAHASEPQTPLEARRAWWLFIWAPAIDSTYIVAGQTLQGYTIIREVSYSSWLRRGTPHLYLLQRQHIPRDT